MDTNGQHRVQRVNDEYVVVSVININFNPQHKTELKEKSGPVTQLCFSIFMNTPLMYQTTWEQISECY